MAAVVWRPGIQVLQCCGIEGLVAPAGDGPRGPAIMRCQRCGGRDLRNGEGGPPEAIVERGRQV
jgi:hypothetical protein